MLVTEDCRTQHTMEIILIIHIMFSIDSKQARDKSMVEYRRTLNMLEADGITLVQLLYSAENQ